MPAKNRPLLNTILPPFDINNFYVYLDTLFTTVGWNKPRDAWATQTRKMAQLNIIGKFKLHTTEEKMSQALEFLRIAAQSERIKEINALLYYKKRLESLIEDQKNNPDLGNDPDIKLFMEKVKNLPTGDLENINFEEYKNLQNDLINAMNLIKTKRSDYITRLRALTDKDLRKQLSPQQLAGRQIQYRLAGDINSLIKDSVGVFKGRGEDNAENLGVAATLRTLVSEYVSKNMSRIEEIVRKNSQKNIMGPLLAAIATDIMIQAQQYFNELQDKGDLGLSAVITEDIVKKVGDLYLKADEENKSYLQQVLQNDDTTELFDILENIAKGFGIKQKALTSRELEALKEERMKLIEESKGKARNKGAKIYVTNDRIFNRLLKIDIKTDVRANNAGYIGEAFAAMTQRGSLTHGRGATDLISIGSITFDARIGQNNQGLDAAQREIRDIIDSSMQSNTTTSRTENYIKQYEAMSKKIRDLIAQLEKENKDKGITDQFFIFHESIKLYQTAEGDNIGKRAFNGFHGVEIEILNAIDRLYGMAQASHIEALQSKSIRAIALNLANGTLASDQKGELEKYLSIFAGLLMFDDAENLARDTTKKLVDQVGQAGTVQTLHVYRLNDIYVPGSVILQHIYNQLQAGLQHINIQKIADVSIHVGSDIQKKVDDFTKDFEMFNALGTFAQNKGYYTGIEQWGEFAEAARMDTKIRISFLSSFIDFLDQLTGEKSQ